MGGQPSRRKHARRWTRKALPLHGGMPTKRKVSTTQNDNHSKRVANDQDEEGENTFSDLSDSEDSVASEADEFLLFGKATAPVFGVGSSYGGGGGGGGGGGASEARQGGGASGARQGGGASGARQGGGGGGKSSSDKGSKKESEHTFPDFSGSNESVASQPDEFLPVGKATTLGVGVGTHQVKNDKDRLSDERVTSLTHDGGGRSSSNGEGGVSGAQQGEASKAQQGKGGGSSSYGGGSPSSSYGGGSSSYGGGGGSSSYGGGSPSSSYGGGRGSSSYGGGASGAQQGGGGSIDTKERMCDVAKHIDGKEFGLTQVVCASNHDDWHYTVKAIQDNIDCTKVGNEIARNLVRVAATRVFGVPEQSIIELVVNSIDASTSRRSVGKFGLGFYSIVYWLHNHPKRSIRITSRFDDTLDMCSYVLQIFEQDDMLKARLSVIPNVVGSSGTLVEILADEDQFSPKGVVRFKRQMKRLALVPDVVLVKKNYHDVEEKDTTIVDRDTFFERNGDSYDGYDDYVATQKMLQRSYARTKKDVAWNLKALDESKPFVNVCIDRSKIAVEDRGIGIPLSTALTSLLTPSLSTKTVMASMDQSKHEQLKTHLVESVARQKSEKDKFTKYGGVNNNTYFPWYKLNVIVNHVIVYYNNTHPVVAYLYMPAWTPVPLSRDNIIVDASNVAEFRQQVGKLLDQALQSQSRYAFVNLEHALKAYELESRQYYITREINDLLRRGYAQHARRIVEARFVPVYEKSFVEPCIIGGTRCDSNAVKRYVLANNRSIDNVFSGRKVILCDMPDVKSTGGLDGVIFVKQSFYDKCREIDKQTNKWAFPLCQDYTLGFGLRLASPSDRTSEYEGYFQLYILQCTQHVAYMWFEGETQNDIQREWDEHRQHNVDLLRTVYDRLRDANKVEFSVFNVSTIMVDLAGCFGMYRQVIWTKLVCIFRDACLSYSPKPEYGNAPPDFDYVASCFTKELIPGQQPCERPDFCFDVDVLQFVTQVGHNLVFSLTKTASLASCLQDNSRWKHFKPVYDTVRHANATTCAKVCMLSAVSHMVDKLKLFKMSTKKMDHWVTKYLPVFDRKVTNVDAWCLHIDYAHDGLMIFQHHVQVVQAARVFEDYVFSNYDDEFLESFTYGHHKLLPNYEFTSNQLISKVLSSNGSAVDVLASISSTSPKSNLQMLGLVINEGNTRPFVVAVLQELVQNAIDVIRSSEGPSKRVSFAFERCTQTNKLVMTVEDPVGMTLDTMFKLNIPFYSGKTGESNNATGEMGTGFFNVFRETERVVVRTKPTQDSPNIIWESTPLIDNNRVVDIHNKVWFEDDQDDSPSKPGTLIRLFCRSDMDASEQAIVFEATIFDMFPVIDSKIAELYLPGRKVNKYEHVSREDLDPGLIRVHGNGFQRGLVCVTVNDNYLKSYVLSNGVVFTDLLHFCNMIGFDEQCAQVLLAGFVIDLPKRAYTVAQSREAIVLDKACRLDVVAALQDCCWISCSRKMALDARSYTDTDWSNVVFLRSLKCELKHLRSTGQIDQTLTNYPLRKHDQLFIRPKGLKDVIESYRVFAPLDARNSGKHPALLELLRQAAKATQSSGETDTNKENAARFAVKDLPSLVRQDVEAILAAWLLTKSQPHKSESSVVSQGNDLVVYSHESASYTMVKTFIDVYIEYGVDKHVRGFEPNMVSQVCLEYNRDENSSFFSPRKRRLTITENTNGEKGDFEKLALAIHDYCSTKNLDTVSLIDLEGTMKQINSGFYESLFGSRRGTVLHELEHARRSVLYKSTGTDNDEGHPDTTESLCFETPKQRDFDTCIYDVAQLIVNHQMNGVLFVHALLDRWKRAFDASFGKAKRGASSSSGTGARSSSMDKLFASDEDGGYSGGGGGRGSSYSGGGGPGRGSSYSGGGGGGRGDSSYYGGREEEEAEFRLGMDSEDKR